MAVGDEDFEQLAGFAARPGQPGDRARSSIQTPKEPKSWTRNRATMRSAPYPTPRCSAPRLSGGFVKRSSFARSSAAACSTLAATWGERSSPKSSTFSASTATMTCHPEPSPERLPNSSGASDASWIESAWRVGRSSRVSRWRVPGTPRSSDRIYDDGPIVAHQSFHQGQAAREAQSNLMSFRALICRSCSTAVTTRHPTPSSRRIGLPRPSTRVCGRSPSSLFRLFNCASTSPLASPHYHLQRHLAGQAMGAQAKQES